MKRKPSPNGSNGRDRRGRFACGNAGGPGNPHARHTAELRAELLNSVTVADVRAIIRKLVALAKRGDTRAARELLDRLLGKSVAYIEQSGEGESAPGRVVIYLPHNNRDPIPPENMATADDYKALDEMHKSRADIQQRHPL